MSDVLLLDVTPLTLGIETAGSIATPMIERNTTVPTKKTQVFSTYADSQTAVDVKVLQGERPMANDNKVLGTFRLDGIPPAPRGTPQIEVTFDIDANGILNVTAKDLGTGKDQKITISGSSGLSKDEVEQLRKEAELHAEEDLKKKEAVQVHNELESLVYASEKQIKELGDKLPSDKKAELEKCLEEGKQALESKDEAAMKKAKEALDTVMQGIAQEIYSKVQQESEAAASSAGEKGPSSPESSSTQTGKDDVIDAEVIDDEPPSDKKA